MRYVTLLALVGCSGGGTSVDAAPENAAPWIVEHTGCTIDNTITVDGQPYGGWIGCRVYWSGAPNHVITFQLMSPGTAGSFEVPGDGWAAFSFSLPAPGTLTTLPGPFPYELPTTVADGKIVEVGFGACPPLMWSGQHEIEATGATFYSSVYAMCGRSGGPTYLTTGSLRIMATGASPAVDLAATVQAN
jgi:hypothetical protein